MIKHRIEITDSRIIQAIELYKSGKAVRPICTELKLDGATLLRFIDELGLRRTRAEAVRRGKSGNAVVHHNALDVLTPEALYWIGFLYADGHIEKDRPRICLTIADADRLHLDKFKQFFGEGLIIMNARKAGMRSNGYVCDSQGRVAFSSPQIYKRLIDLGFSNRKTWDITPHDLLKNSRDFWRGVVDGDGWMLNIKYKGIDSYACLGLSGQETTLNEFLSFLRRNGLETKAEVHKKKNREFLWSVELHSNVARIAGHVLYKDAIVYLDRKYEKYIFWQTMNQKINQQK